MHSDTQVQAFWEYWSSLPKSADGLPQLRDYLDHAPPRLQPNVAIADVHSPEQLTVRLFGTALVEITGADLTGINPLSVYRESIRRLAGQVAWRAVVQPCGYITNRVFRTKIGRLLNAPGIVLPVEITNVSYRAVFIFTNLNSAREALYANETFEIIHDVEFVSWVDLGKGIPAMGV